MAQNSVAARMQFENAVALLQRSGLDVTSARLTQSYLRSEVPASTSSTNYKFPVLINDQPSGVGANTQNLLNLQDWFITTEIGVFIAKAASATDTAFTLNTFPSSSEFPTGSDALNTLYQGKLSLSIDNNNILPSWDVARHYFVGQTQQGVPAASINQLDLSENGFYPVEPNLIINGGANIQFQLVLPSAFAALDANTRIIVIQRGILAQNVTNVR